MLGQARGGRVPSTKEVLLEHLYMVVLSMQPAEAAQITGSYAHLQETQLLQLLTNKALLTERVQESLHSLRVQTPGQPTAQARPLADDIHVPHTDELGAQLFNKVAEHEPKLCAQITGMLLELEPDVLHDLLTEPSQLASAVATCKDRYLDTQQECRPPYSHRSGVTGSDVQVSVNYLAEELFACVTRHYPHNAAKLTGMLLEIGAEKLDQLVMNFDLQEACIKRCVATLISTGQWVDERERS